MSVDIIEDIPVSDTIRQRDLEFLGGIINMGAYGGTSHPALAGVRPVSIPFTGISGRIRLGSVSPSDNYIEMEQVVQVK